MCTLCLCGSRQLSEKSLYKLNDQCDQQTKNDHRRNRKIKPEIFFFNPDISGQSADPVKFVVEKINNDTDDDNEYADCNDPFPGFTVHRVKLFFISDEM